MVTVGISRTLKPKNKNKISKNARNDHRYFSSAVIPLPIKQKETKKEILSRERWLAGWLAVSKRKESS